MSEREKEARTEPSQDHDAGEEPRQSDRRDALKKILAASGIVAAGSSIPGKWNPAVVEAVARPPGDMSPPPTTTTESTTTTTESTTTTTESTTPFPGTTGN